MDIAHLNVAVDLALGVEVAEREEELSQHEANRRLAETRRLPRLLALLQQLPE